MNQPTQPPVGKPRILVVEDDRTVASYIELKLAELGYESVGQAASGRQAITLAQQLRPDLVLMDVMLEGDTDGIAAAQAIREQLPVPVVFLSAFSDDEIIERAKLAGPLGYILKPFTDRELRTGIEMALYKHETEARLHAAEERLRLVLLGSNDGIWDRDLAGGELFYSPRWFEMLGYAPDELQVGPQMWIDLVHPDDAGYARQFMESHWASSDSNYTMEVRLRHKDGHYLPVLSRAYIVRDANGKAIRVAGTTTDMTPRKQAEIDLRASEQRFRDLVDSTDGIVWEADASTFGFTYVSGNATRLLGYPVADWLQPGFWASHIHPADRDQAIQYCAACTGRIEDHDFEYRFVALDGRVVWLRDIVRVVAENGQARWMRGLMVDITERKRADRVLEESLREKAALLSEVHHRVKNNLQVINSLLRLEAGRSNQPSTQSVLGDMQGRIQSMALLHESLYRSGTLASVDLGVYLGQISKQAFQALADRAGPIQLRLAMASVPVTMDHALPCGLLVNELVSNCLKHGFPNGRSGEVRVELLDDHGDGRLCLRVSDTGVGLPADFESRRGDSLGLQLAMDLAQQLDGKFEVGSGPVAMFTLNFNAERPMPTKSPA